MDRKLIFDAVRRLLGRGFRQDEVAALDAALDSALRPTARSRTRRRATSATQAWR
jgi:hypothetical protein